MPPVYGILRGTGSDFSEDPQMMGWYEPGSLADRAPNDVWSSLIPTGGAVPTGVGVDAQPTYQIRKAAGHLFSTKNTVYLPPIHILLVAQVPAGFTPAANDTWLASIVNGGWFLSWRNAALLGIGTTPSFAAVPASPALYDIYIHRTYSQVQINGGAAIPLNVSQSGLFMNGISLGLFGPSSSFPADLDVSFLQVWEGQINQASKQSVYTYLKNKFPTLALPSVAPGQINLASPAIGGLFNASNPWKYIPVLGQSNAKTHSTVATATPGANTFELLRDSSYAALVSLYDDQTLQTDEVSADALVGAAVGGFAPSMMNAAVARYAQPTVLVSGAKDGSYRVQGQPLAGNTIQQWWGRESPRGQHQRDSLYWSAVARVLDAKSKTGAFAYLVHWGGESEGEAIDPFYPTNVGIATLAILTAFFADTSLPMRVILVVPPATVPTGASASPANWNLMRTNLAALDNGTTIRAVGATNGPFETGNLHLQGAALDSTGAAIDAMAASMGW